MIEIVDLHKTFGDNHVLRGVNLTIEEGETNVIIGKSGSGKSVLLKHIVGLLLPDQGYVKVGGEIIDGNNQTKLYEIRRKFGYLFQGAALFDSMTVGENIALPLVENNYNFSQMELDKKITEIALDVGFDNSSYLILKFKKYMGCTPSKYRKIAV